MPFIRQFCIHGHFYQPPREDPLTEAIPVEPGAAPYPNWNERIFAECYRPNTDLGNFERISFNVGPTLFQWMERSHPEYIPRIVEQDRKNVARWGAGNAMAQAYNHAILPLASRQDKLTQVRWGIADFRYRFGRSPRGMWLPETAVNFETLEVLAECGIEFTILAPWQAEGLPPNEKGHPYWVYLPEGKRIAVFFYNQELSTRVSFDPGATSNADEFIAEALLPQYAAQQVEPGEPELVLIASDGELYGHHQPFRDKFLAYLMDGALARHEIRPTFPELWLQENPPDRAILICENTSWSCHHGVLRWAGDCACTPHSGWKEHLRAALNHLAALLDGEYLAAANPLVASPWELRDEYIHVLLGEQSLDDLIFSAAGKRLDPADVSRLASLLQAQYERQRMFTSCGWFFEDFDRIEPRNNVAYAAQAVWLTAQAGGRDLTPEALAWLKPVTSQRTGLRGDQVFAAHIARVSSLQAPLGQSASLPSTNQASPLVP